MNPFDTDRTAYVYRWLAIYNSHNISIHSLVIVASDCTMDSSVVDRLKYISHISLRNGHLLEPLKHICPGSSFRRI
jgi:hypothetical protein